MRRNYQNNVEINQQFIKLIKENDQITLGAAIGIDKATESIYYIDEINNSKNNNYNRYYNYNYNNNDRQDEKEDNFINDRITLLHVAAYFNSLECFVYLHEVKGISLRAPTTRSFYPLHYACFNGSREIVAYILSHDSNQIELFNKTNLILCFAVHGGDPVILEALFNNGMTLKKAQNPRDDPILKGISIDNYRCCEVLVRYSEGYSNDFTPAMTAAKMANPELLQYFVRSKSDIEFSPLVQKSVISLIFEISNGENFKKLILSWLYKFDDLEIEPPFDMKETNGVCHWVCKMADYEVAKLMVKTQNVIINRIGANNHLGPYYLANKTGSTSDDEIIKILGVLFDKGFDPNFQPETGFCEPVLKCFLRTIKIRYPVIAYLVERGANPNIPWAEDRKSTVLDEIKKRKNDKKLMEIFHDFL